MRKTNDIPRDVRHGRRGTLAAVALTAAVVLVAGQPVSADAGPIKRGEKEKVATSAHFNSPGSRTIFNHLEDLIDGTPKGYKIRVAEFRLQDKKITDALTKAADRGVHVQVVVDRSAIDGKKGTERDNARKLYTALNSLSDKETFMRACGTPSAGSCKGTNAMHSKIFMFSRTSGSSAVTAIGTANMNVDTLGGTGGWNSFYTDVGNKSLYKRYAKYFDDLADGGKKDPNYYQTLPPQIHVDVKSYFYPREKGDTTVNTLKTVSCARGRVQIAAWSFSREAVAKELRDLANRGCTVEIVTNKFKPEVCKELFKGKTPKTLTVRGFSASKGERGVHTKDMTIKQSGTSKSSQAVYTGSLNLNKTSLRLNDETAIRIMDNKGIYADYAASHAKISNEADIKATGEKSCNKIGH